MIKLNQAVIVEGKYDKIKLESVLDAVILTTDGFGVFKDKEKQRLIRRLAKERGILVLTDSDSAGFMIRHYLNGLLPKEQVRHAYIPDVLGKERRKPHPSREGKLGVEGMTTEVLREALRRAGVGTDETPSADPVTKTDLFEDGLTGGTDSAALRLRLLRVLQLPENMTTNAMLQAINSFMTRTEYRAAVAQLRENERKAAK